jgi:DNA-binding CsgD family transcriptional regulator
MIEAPVPILPVGGGGGGGGGGAARRPPPPPPPPPPDRVLPLPAGRPEEPSSRGAGALPGVPAALAGRVRAHVIERDPLLRLHVVAAARALGFAIADELDGGPPSRPQPAVLFVGLDLADACPRCGAGGSAAFSGQASQPLLVGYGAGSAVALAAHRLHGCADLYLCLRAVGGRARLAHLAAGDAPAAAGLTRREADVLILLLAGFSTAAVANRLCVSPATARSHSRAVLHKLGAADRRARRAPGPRAVPHQMQRFA